MAAYLGCNNKVKKMDVKTWIEQRNECSRLVEDYLRNRLMAEAARTSWRKVAARCGVSSSLLWDFSRNGRGLSPKMQDKVAAVLSGEGGCDGR